MMRVPAINEFNSLSSCKIFLITKQILLILYNRIREVFQYVIKFCLPAYY